MSVTSCVVRPGAPLRSPCRVRPAGTGPSMRAGRSSRADDGRSQKRHGFQRPASPQRGHSVTTVAQFTVSVRACDHEAVTEVQRIWIDDCQTRSGARNVVSRTVRSGAIRRSLISATRRIPLPRDAHRDRPGTVQTAPRSHPPWADPPRRRAEPHPWRASGRTAPRRSRPHDAPPHCRAG